ncbi:unnamed protein product, partial [Choristocarpus tenellus]
RVCNLVGNLCRHSDYFYGALQPPGLTGAHRGRGVWTTGRGVAIASLLIERCSDPDPTTRKFASIAVGNAAFHSGALYPLLRSSVVPLMVVMREQDEKTRGNATGSLGNLVRNGGLLSDELARRGAVAALLDVAGKDVAPSPRRIALFSLGTCCVYVACREAFYR